MLFVNNLFFKITSSIIGLISFISSNVLKTWNPNKLSQSCRNNATTHWNLYKDGIHLLQLLKRSSLSTNEVEKRLKYLIELRSKSNENIENAWSRSVDKASDEIKNRKDNQISEDRKYFIPKNLKM